MTTKMMAQKLNAYLDDMAYEELSKNTISKYLRDIRFFMLCNEDKQVIGKKEMIRYKELLLGRYKISTVNSYLISVNRYLLWLGAPEVTTKTIRLQRRTNLEDVLTREEYGYLLQYCLTNSRTRDYLLLRTIASTGIRVGELRYITYETVKHGSVEIYNKGKCRMIIIPEDLSMMLVSYCAEKGITEGVIFLGQKARSILSVKSVWKQCKRIAAGANVDASKVYPHNLRHLFAKTYMQKIGNIFELADLLGHSNIESTRIYALSSQAEKRKSLSELGL